MKKQLLRILTIAIMLSVILGRSGTALAEARDFSIRDLGVGVARFSTRSMLKRQTDIQAYCDVSYFTGGIMTCRLYLSDKKTKAMNNAMTIINSDLSDTGAITYGAGTAYSVYMSFKNSGTQQFHVDGVWGARN